MAPNFFRQSERPERSGLSSHFYLSDFFFMKLGTSGVKPRRG